MDRKIKIGNLECGEDEPLLFILGPCVLETEELTLTIASRLKEISNRCKLNIVFKASFDKANRSSGSSYRGVGIDEGLRILGKIKTEFDIPVTTDIHLPEQAEQAAKVCDVLQIPAFLARQTDLLVAAAKTGKVVNVKKGQFMSPIDMIHVAQKLRENGAENFLLCERGTFFGYGNLVNDMTSLPQMRAIAPVIFDATHSVQKPGGATGKTGGNREFVAPLARAAVATGVDGVFLETHPDPDTSPSDGANMVPLDQIETLLVQLSQINDLVSSF